MLRYAAIELLGSSLDRTFKGSQDSRLSNSRGCLGFHMLVFAGMVPGVHSPKTDRNKQAEFPRLLLECIHESDSKLEAQTEHLLLLTNGLRDGALTEADLVVTTAASLGSCLFTTALKPHVVMVDDAAHVSEAMTNVIFGYYPSCRHLLLIGDGLHRPPEVHTRPYATPNIFEAQMKMSLFTRLLQLALPAMRLNTSLRTNAELILPIISLVTYGGNLNFSDGPIDPVAQQIAGAFETIYGHNRAANLFKLQTAPVRFVTAWQNEASAFAVLGLLIKLVKHGISKINVVVRTKPNARLFDAF